MNFLANIKYDFMGKRKIAMVFSLTLILLSLGALVTRGLNFGLDFTGGTVVVVHFDSSVEAPAIRDSLHQKGFADAVVKNFGSSKDIEITLPPYEVAEADADADQAATESGSDEAKLSNEILTVLQQVDSSARISKADFVGSQVGDELVEQGSLAMLYAIIGILMYVTFRFEWRFSLGAVAALVHDVVITAGIFSAFQVEFDLTVLAALLAVIGYSLNDTIVVFDRVRENFRAIRKTPPAEVMNISIGQTLSRTVITSLTTMLVLIALYVFGGALINSFAFALIIGVVVGTYSSIFVASTTTLALGISREDLIPVEKEGADLSHIP
ncbi:protein translocase subunit SecF [Marinicella rhabdoformis]|uniref:protein translocase subunit SecF n=1 Tax=Marinicella rhabdoformis TaxID=2580566 RepID=UPI0012AEC82C|nr:protein translocase subunit SecF [Marinicella rhabdoformis]